MAKEYHSLKENETWDLVPRLQGKIVVNFLCIYKTKFTYHGAIEIHKVGLVERVFSLREGIDYTKTSVSVAKKNYV